MVQATGSDQMTGIDPATTGLTSDKEAIRNRPNSSQSTGTPTKSSDSIKKIARKDESKSEKKEPSTRQTKPQSDKEAIDELFRQATELFDQ